MHYSEYFISYKLIQTILSLQLKCSWYLICYYAGSLSVWQECLYLSCSNTHVVSVLSPYIHVYHIIIIPSRNLGKLSACNTLMTLTKSSKILVHTYLWTLQVYFRFDCITVVFRAISLKTKCYIFPPTSTWQDKLAPFSID